MDACQRSSANGNSILLELLNSKEIKQYVRDSITGWIDAFSALTTDSAVEAMKRIGYDLKYRDYLREKGIDNGKLSITI